MKTQITRTRKIWGIGVILALAASAGCSSVSGGKSGQDIAATGPTVVNPRTNPGTFELSTNFQPTQPAEILADVKDFTGRVSSVTLRFIHAPLEIPMEKISETTWRATLTPQQLKLLAVNGQTMKYDASIIARDENGQVAVSDKPVTVAIKAPEVGKTVTG